LGASGFGFFLLLTLGQLLACPARFRLELTVNSEFCKKALEKVGNPNVLVNLISRRVRQLTSGAGGFSRPLILDSTGLGAADIALREIIEEKIGWDMPETVELVRPTARKRRKR
jgi:DNA-directed RNA polymerase subunit omega